MSFPIFGVEEQHSYMAEKSTQVMNEGLAEVHFEGDQELSFHTPYRNQHDAEGEVWHQFRQKETWKLDAHSETVYQLETDAERTHPLQIE
jgi:hypothetical protein